MLTNLPGTPYVGEHATAPVHRTGKTAHAGIDRKGQPRHIAHMIDQLIIHPVNGQEMLH